MSQHYVITGGAGFIGSHLVDALLLQGHRVTVIDNFSTGERKNLPEKIELIDADIVEYAQWDSLFKDCQGCFHLAAVASVSKCSRDHHLAHHTNVLGTLKIFELAAAHGVPVVFASSSAVYGSNPELPLSEASNPEPQSIYAVDKLSCEFYARAFHKSYGLDVVSLRFFNVFGPRQHFERNLDSGVIANFIHQIKKGETLTIFGTGEQTRDFIYVADVVRALQLAMEQPNKNAGIYNVCTGIGHSINQLIEIIKNQLSILPKIDYQSAHVGDVMHSLGSPKKIQEALGFVPEYDLESGIKNYGNPSIIV